MKEIETAATTPEQLLQMLDVQMAMRRAERAGTGRNRTMLLVGGLLFILIAAGVALLVLLQMLGEMQNGERHGGAPTAAATPAGNL